MFIRMIEQTCVYWDDWTKMCLFGWLNKHVYWDYWTIMFIGMT